MSTEEKIHKGRRLWVRTSPDSESPNRETLEPFDWPNDDVLPGWLEADPLNGLPYTVTRNRNDI